MMMEENWYQRLIPFWCFNFAHRCLYHARIGITEVAPSYPVDIFSNMQLMRRIFFFNHLWGPLPYLHEKPQYDTRNQKLFLSLHLLNFNDFHFVSPFILDSSATEQQHYLMTFCISSFISWEIKIDLFCLWYWKSKV